MNYFMGLAIEHYSQKKLYKKIALVLAIIFNLIPLFYFKYFNFAMNNVNDLLNVFNYNSFNFKMVALPVGISFYTFHALSYIIDLYRGEVKVQKNLFMLMLYISLFPQLVAGPIVRYIDVEKDLIERTVTASDFAYGIRRFCIGIVKKVLIANNVALFADAVFNSSATSLSTTAAWIGIICYTLQIYFDFSAYSDMAIGIGRMLGFKFLENFNYPYISKSVKEFWRRWHISLSTWFRDFLYIPLGGNRKGTFRTYVNLMIVFILCGLWHGARWTFVFWGFYNGAFLILERRPWFAALLNKCSLTVRHLYTLIIVMIGWVFFRSDSMTYAINYIAAMFGFTSGKSVPYYNVSNSLLLVSIIVGILFSIPITNCIKVKLDKFQGVWCSIFKGLYDFTLIILLIICISKITVNCYNPFIYFRF